MDVELIFQIAGVGIIVTVINQLLSRAGRDEQALMITIAGLVVVLFILTERIGELFHSIKLIFDL
ncbi:MAG: stage III sporulation protein AC [Clostridia bacterium]|nr:stage III sporulation protein AC [Clostridia bacterium]